MRGDHCGGLDSGPAISGNPVRVQARFVDLRSVDTLRRLRGLSISGACEGSNHPIFDMPTIDRLKNGGQAMMSSLIFI